MLNTTSQRSHLLARLHSARAHTDELFGIVRPAFLFERPIAERHRLAFYIGHLDAFDWNLLSAPLGLTSEQEALDTLFAFGIDPVDGQLPSDQPSDWPPLQEFLRYRQQARERLDAVLHRDAVRGDETSRIDLLLNVAIEHRQMHAETLSYLMHRMPFDQKRAAHAHGSLAQRSVEPETVTIAGGATTLGAHGASAAFGWDNEFEAHDVDVPTFRIDKYKVTNQQYLAFVDDGGYARRDLWPDADWNWKEENSVSHPAFWMLQDGRWHWRAMFEAIPLPLDWPVYVSQAEASAYARWAARKLPTEEQWQRAAFGADDDAPFSLPGEEMVLSLDRADDTIPTQTLPLKGRASERSHSEPPLHFDPLAVDAADLISSGPFPVVGMHGNGWEWTSTVFAPFAGFRRFDFYPGYSEPFFDGKHFVLKGGSVRTAAAMLRPSFRNWFQPHYPYVYAGFRCVDAEEG
jgi:ergothioneine biosynthesis protein EgtB